MRISDWSSDVCSSDLRTGGGGVVGHAAIAQAPADGYTIGVITIEIGTFKWLGQSDLSGSKDYTPIALYNFAPGAFYVAADSPFKNAKEVVRALKANPRTYKLASRSEEHTSELQSLMRISYAVFCLKNNQ